MRVVKEGKWYPAKMGEVTYHPACTKPEAQSAEDYARLVEDVKQHGVRTPILVRASDNCVLNGRHRIRAAREAGCPIPVKYLDVGSEAECWSIARSELCHRNLTPSKMATLYLDMKDEEEKAAKAESAQKAKEKDKGDEEKSSKPAKKKKGKGIRSERGGGKKSAKEAKEAGVSPAVIERAKKVRAKGIPVIWKAMDAEEITANDAAYIVDFDHETQKAALALIREKKCKTLKAAKAILDKQAKAEAGPGLKDGKNQNVPKELIGIFEDRELFALLREDLKSLGKRYNDLCKRAAGKYLPKNLGKHILDAAEACDLYQPFAVADNNDGWITKRSAKN